MQASSPTSTARQTFTIRPTDLVFAWSECRRCFWFRQHGEPELKAPFPKVFAKIDAAMKRRLVNSDTSELIPLEGKFLAGERLRSAAISMRESPVELVLQGQSDFGIATSDQRFGVVDAKTVHSFNYEAERYWSQLESYAYCFEHPARGEPRAVDFIGLLCWHPQSFALSFPLPETEPTGDQRTHGELLGALRWIPVERNRDRFLELLEAVASILVEPSPPPPGEDCSRCQLRDYWSRQRLPAEAG
jgi:hypothetical protein